MVGIYCRVSSQGQKDNYSIPVQKKFGIKFCESINEEYKIYSEAKSATEINRPKLQDLIQDIEDAITNKIWVIELDRLSRSAYDAQLLKKLYEEHKIELYENGKYYDFSAPDSRFLYNVKSALAELNRDKIIERIKRGQVARANEGMKSFSELFGYNRLYDKRGNVSYEINQEEAEIIVFIFRKYLENISQFGIARLLNDNHKKTKLGGSWVASQVGLILKRMIYTGHYEDENGDIIISKQYPAIITMELYDEVRKNYTSKFIPKPKNMVKMQSSSIVLCGSCGQKYKFHRAKSKGHEYPAYRAAHLTSCKNIRRGYENTAFDRLMKCVYYFFFSNKAELEKYYQKEIEKAKQKDESSVKRKANLEKAENRLLRRKENLVNAIAEDIISRDDARLKIQEINSELAEIGEKLERFSLKSDDLQAEKEAVLDGLVIDGLVEFLEGDPTKRRNLIRSVIRKATVMTNKLSIEYLAGLKLKVNLEDLDTAVENLEEIVGLVDD